MLNPLAFSPKSIQQKGAFPPLQLDPFYLAIASTFIATLCLMNVLNITRILQVDWSLGSYMLTMTIPIGILPYPLTFLCTDIVSECYGRKAANQLVTAGFIANLWMLLILWISGLVQPHTLEQAGVFSDIRLLGITTILSSMLAYLVAQYLDVYLFHFFMRLTNRKHLWLRNNVSTIISQWVDTCIVLGCTLLSLHYFSPEIAIPQGKGLGRMILSSYAYKFCAALIDTLPCYFLVWWIRRSISQTTVSSKPSL